MLQETTRPDVPKILLPISPPDESLVNGESVVFEWNAVEGATRYRLEIAEDSKFETLIALYELTELESVTVAGVLETDGRVYHWRVFAGNDAGWSRSEDAIHGFYSGSAQMVEENVHRPNHVEIMGPITELLTGQAGADTYFAEATPEPPMETDASDDVVGFYNEEEILGVEREGIEVRMVFERLALTIAVIATLLFVTFHLFQWRAQSWRNELAGQTTYPEREALEAEFEGKLNQYEVIDAGTGMYRIPIDSAMRIMGLETIDDLTEPASDEVTLK